MNVWCVCGNESTTRYNLLQHLVTASLSHQGYVMSQCGLQVPHIMKYIAHHPHRAVHKTKSPDTYSLHVISLNTHMCVLWFQT
jgi:hypothetical protein